MIENLLRSYRDKVGKIKLINIKMDELEELLKDMQQDISELSASRITDEGKALHKFNSAVENYATNIEDINEREYNIISQIEELSKRKFELQKDIDKADAHIERLPMEERYIMKWFYVEGLSWGLIEEQYKKEFGQYRDKSTLKRKRDNAMIIIGAA